ncbi:MAG: hypothetical protein KBS66_07880 [Eubacterium sp.]|nr:hypothetical protein [Candidatus Colimonas fimequi]
MSKLVWDQTGEKTYETGVRMGVLYPQASDGTYPIGYAWNGLTSVKENASGGEATPLWADDQKYLDLMSTEEFSATIEAYASPKAFDECDGSKEIMPGVYAGQQNRKSFGFSYRTTLGNDVEGNDYAYQLHLVYGLKAQPSEKSYSSINDSPEANTLSWESKATPVPTGEDGFKSTATLTIDSRYFTDPKFIAGALEDNGDVKEEVVTAAKAKLAALEKVLYGSTEANARLPFPDEVKKILNGEISG